MTTKVHLGSASKNKERKKKKKAQLRDEDRFTTVQRSSLWQNYKQTRSHIKNLFSHLSRMTTSRMLMRPNTAASNAGVVYMLSFSAMKSSVTPSSPMKDRHACRADMYTEK